MRELMDLIEATDEGLTMQVDGDTGQYDDGEPWGDYRFDIKRPDGVKVLSVYAGVNIIKHDVRTGLDTLFVIDVIPTRDSGFPEVAASGYGAYSRGIRIGSVATRNILRDIVERVRKDFPAITKIAGHRTSGARKVHKKKSSVVSQKL